MFSFLIFSVWVIIVCLFVLKISKTRFVFFLSSFDKISSSNIMGSFFVASFIVFASAFFSAEKNMLFSP